VGGRWHCTLHVSESPGAIKLSFAQLTACIRTCRQIYAETRQLPFKYSEYDLVAWIQIDVLSRWLKVLDWRTHESVWGNLNEYERMRVMHIRAASEEERRRLVFLDLMKEI
jgi:hypothetical protein